MKHKLYYYEVTLEVKVTSKEESFELVDNLISSSFHVLGFDSKVSKSKNFKGEKLKLQLFSFTDVISKKDEELLLLSNVHLVNYRTRSITGEDNDIIRNYYVMSSIMLSKLQLLLGLKEKSLAEHLKDIKEVSSNDKESD